MRKLETPCRVQNRRARRVRRGIETLEPRLLLSTTWMVTLSTDSPSGPYPGELRYAVQAAQPGDTIEFNPQSFPATQKYFVQLQPDDPLVLKNNVTIVGVGSNVVGVSGTNHSSNQGMVFTINAGVTAEIDGLLITNGFQELGNAAGIDNEGTLTLNNCAVTNCSTPQNGGGIFNNGTLTLTNTTVSGNHAANGAGIYSQAGSVTLNGCTISSNTSPGGHGAGLYNAGTLLVTNSTFSGNSVDNSSAPPIGAGGGIWNGGAKANIYSSTFSANSALNGVGAGIFSSGTRLNLFNSTFYGNTAGGQGRGGALNADGYVLGVNCTMVNNSAKFGGAIDVGDAGAGDVTLYNTILAQNTASSSANGNDIYGTLDEDYLNPFGFNTPVGPQYSSNNLIDDASSAGGLFTNDGYGNIVGVPAKVGSLANNGGPTQTVNLLSGSPAIDAGSNSLAQDFSTSTPTPLPTDQRGLSRIYNNVVDIGAIEIQPPPVPTGLVATPEADEIDLSWPATPGAATYTIYRGFAPGAESPTPLASNVTGTSYIDTGVTAGVTFYYTIVASNGLLTSAPSAEASATPTLPVLNAAQIGDTITFSNDADKLHIDWSTATANGRMLINDPHGLTINGDGNNDILVLNQSPYAFNVALPLVTHLNGTFTIKNLWNLTYTNGTEQLVQRTIDIGLSTVYVELHNTFPSLSASQVVGYVLHGYDNGAWDGQPTSKTGVITTSAGSADNGIGYASFGDGSNVDTIPNTIELRTTVYGDANLDGTVNLADFLAVSRNFGKTTAAWDQGDFNYDGSVNLSDLLTLTRHFGKSIPAPTIVTAEASLAAATRPLSDPLSIRRRR